MNEKHILVTVVARYIGSHFVKLLKRKNYNVVVLDNLSRGNQESIPESVSFENVDLLNINDLESAMLKYDIDTVVHFAAFAYVGESVTNPSIYYRNNVIGSYNLIETCRKLNIDIFIFSSTCSIYGNPDSMPISEKTLPNPINPYANTKFIFENILKEYNKSYKLN